MEPFAEISESDARTTYMVRPVWKGRTAFQDVAIADSPVYGRMLFLDGELQSASSDEHIYHETLVHPAIATIAADTPYSRRRGARVLVVGGGEGATVREVLRWTNDVRSVVWVDIDTELVELCDKHLGWAPGVTGATREDRRVTFYGEDIQKTWAREDLGRFDVIILDLPDPDGDTGYLYSTEFWDDVVAHLDVGGVVVTHCGPVRPIGNVGEGFQRVLAAFKGRGGGGRFYHIGIPSFQGDWGFYMWWRESPLTGGEWPPAMPAGLRVVDSDQLNAWARSSKLWMDAVAAAAAAAAEEEGKLTPRSE